MEKRPTPQIQERPPRPKFLRELYKLVVKICPNAGHNEEEFIRSIMTQLARDPRNNSLKSEVEKQSLNLAFKPYWSLNDFWQASYAYLISIGVSGSDIQKLREVVGNGFI